MELQARQLLSNRLSLLSTAILGSDPVSEESTDDFICRIESLYADAVDLDLQGITTIPPPVFQNIRECIKCLEETYEPSGTACGPGRPPFVISCKQLEHLLELGFTTVSMASILGVSRSTVARRMRDYALSASLKYCCISDNDLDDVVRSTSQQYPGCGHKMMQGHLKARGIVLQQQRMRESLRRTDPEGIVLRRRVSVHRRAYNISLPLELWHIDGNHKLIR